MPRPVIVGHRGAAAVAPENTLSSFQAAEAAGAEGVELDVRLTLDGVVVCFHDDRLDRLTPARGPLAERTWAELAEFRVLPGAFHGAFPDARIPTLGEVYTALAAGTRVVVEMKAVPADEELLVERTLAIIESAGALARTRIISFEQDLLRRVRRRNSSVALGVLAGRGDFPTLYPRAQEVGAAVLHVHHSLLDAPFLTEAHDRGFFVNAWTVNTVEAARRLSALGADEITTDDPALLLRSS